MRVLERRPVLLANRLPTVVATFAYWRGFHFLSKELMNASPLSAALILTGYSLAAVRLLTAAKPLWGVTAPARWATVILPAVLVGTGTIPDALKGVTTWTDVMVALVTAIGAGFAASRGPAPKPPESGGTVSREGVIEQPAQVDDEDPASLPGVQLLVLTALLLVSCASTANDHPACTAAELQKTKMAYETDVHIQCAAFDVLEECPAYPKLKADFERNVDRGCQ